MTRQPDYEIKLVYSRGKFTITCGNDTWICFGYTWASEIMRALTLTYSTKEGIAPPDYRIEDDHAPAR